MNPSNLFDDCKGPIPFIVLEESKGFVITPQAEEFLSTLESKNIGVVSVVGKYRTGKSYLLNKVLAQPDTFETGFKVGPTINACTRGIWLYSKTIRSENIDEPDMELLLMDTEGFGGVNEGHNHDTRIFLFSILLSSLFVYNSVGSIDENALQALSLIVNLAKNVQKSETGLPGANNKQLDDETIKNNFPFFMWVLRDFSLQLIDENQKSINSNKYLENALQLVKGNTETIEEKNKVRRLLKHFFVNRECATLIRPVEKESDLQKLEDLDDFELRPEFLKQANIIRNIILKKTPSKTFNNRKLDGVMLLQLAKAYAISINSGKAPSLDYAWNYMKSFENEKLFYQIMDDFKKDLPIIKGENDIKNIKKRLSARLMKNQIGDFEENIEQMQYFDDVMDKELQVMYESHKRKVKSAIAQTIDQNCKNLKRKLMVKNDITLEGCEELLQDETEDIKNQFKNQLNINEVEKIVDLNFSLKRSELMSIVYKKIEVKKEKQHRETELKQMEELNSVKEEINILRDMLDERDSQLEEERTKNRILKREKESIEQELEKIKEKTKEIENMESNLLTNRSKISQGEYLELQEEFLNMKKENENTIQKKNTEIAVLNQQLELKRKDYETLKNFCDQQEETNQNAEDRIRDLQEKYQQAITDLDENKMKTDRQSSLTDKKTILELKEKDTENQDLISNYEKIVNQLNSEKLVLEKNYELIKYTLEEAVGSKNNMMYEVMDKLDELTSKKDQPVNRQTEDMTELINKYSAIVQCANCERFLSGGIFSIHLKKCLKKDFNISAFDDKENEENHLEIVFESSSMKEESVKSLKNSKNKSNFVSYVFRLQSHNRMWRINKKFTDFYQLVIDLKEACPEIELPSVSYKLTEIVEDVWAIISGKNFESENRKKMLLELMIKLSQNKAAREHIIFRRFIGEVDYGMYEEEEKRKDFNGVSEDKYYLQQLSKENL